MANPITQQATKRAVIYLRVSSAQQADKDYDAEGYSIPAQREACARQATNCGASVVAEFIDRGESATTAKRPQLRAMLDRLQTEDIDLVIVHKLDRLARNRADDVEIVMAIRQTGAQLVSVTENIDETPSGLLLHGIMSSMAEYFSRNLATEVKKGSTRKAQAGGTPYKPPLGYLNTRTEVDGREIRIVTLDPDYAPLMRDAFQLYATGDYSLAELATVMEDRGLRNRATRKFPARPVPANKLHTLLTNPYYLGKVPYAGKVYDGRHKPLVDEATFQEVQDLLTSKRLSGERPWKHFHYLRGSIFCGDCGRRLIYSRAKGNGGEYQYFICGGRQHGDCTARSHRVEAVEIGVENAYDEVELTSAESNAIRTAASEHIGAISAVTESQAKEAKLLLAKLDRQERKLLAAHYADEISSELFSEEQARIRREREGATKRVEQLGMSEDQTMAALDLALELLAGIGRAYRLAGPQERRLFNQGLFEWLRIVEEDVGSSRLNEPFDDLRHLAKDWSSTQNVATRRRKDKTPEPLLRAGGLNVESLVPLRGFEPRFPD